MPVAEQTESSALAQITRLLSVGLALAVLTSPLPTYGQEAAPVDTPEVDAEVDEAEEEENVRPLLDLGDFRINDLRPTRNETAKLTFSMHLALSKDLNKKQLEQLESWKHRLRDQVITAVRIATIKDFQEPDLSRVRRIVLIRVNRLFRANLAEDVLLTEYLFRTH